MMNENSFDDLAMWLETLQKIGFNPAELLPAVAKKISRVDRLQHLYRHHRSSSLDTQALSRRIGLTANLDDFEQALAELNTAVAAHNDSQRNEIQRILTNAIDAAMGAAIGEFRNTPILDRLRPGFDALAARLTSAAKTLPIGVATLEDATRLGHADTYLQLEKDAHAWEALGKLIGTWLTKQHRVLASTGHTAIEFMFDDVDAFRAVRLDLGGNVRLAHAIAAGRPHLHAPTGKPNLDDDDNRTRQLGYQASRDEREARASLGLARR